MIKKITITSLTSLMLLSQSANSEIKAGPLTLTPGIMLQSNYVGEFTGYGAINRSKPTYGADINISHNSGIYVYSAVKESKSSKDEDTIAAYGTYDWEFCNSLGYATKIQNLGLDVSYENCYQDKKTEKNIGTFYLRANYDLTKKTNVGAAYALDSTDGFMDVDDNDNPVKWGENGYKVFISQDLNLLKATATYGKTDNFTDWYSLGLNKDLFSINFDLTFWNVYDTASWINSDKSIERKLLVLSAKKTF